MQVDRRLEPTPPMPHRPFVIAHRSGNSLLALRTAEAHGLRVIEADVHLFRGRIEVRHLKTLGPVPVLWDRWTLASPFGRRLVLAELLEAAGAQTELVLDLKGRERRLATAVLDLLRPRLDAGAPVTICARSWPLLEQLGGVEGVRRVHSVGSARQLRRLRRRAAGSRIDGISIHERLLDGETVLALSRYADVVMTWPVRTAEQARLLLGWGVAGLITDVPEQLAGVLPAGAPA
jgi:glycerophosphoryl diester phosphodiesterase